MMLSTLVSAALLVPQVAAADTTDSRFTPWLGCFELIGDEVRLPLDDPFADDAELEGESEREAFRSRQARVCLTPDEAGSGAIMQTFADGDVFLEDGLVADGVPYPVDEGPCSGWQSASWSGDGDRLYTLSELTCDEGRRRRVSGISLFLGSTWVEIQSVGSAGSGSVQIRRYRAVDENETIELTGLSPETLRRARRARLERSATLSSADVIEAVQATDSAVVEAALLETQSRVALDAETLRELADGGVAPELIDLMVALAYPERFVIDRGEDDGFGGGYYGYGPYDYDPSYRSALAYPYYYAPFGYYYWYAPYHPIYGVRPVPSPGASVGRAVAGRGYTRVERSGPRFSGGGGGESGERRAKSRGSSGGSGSGSDSTSVGSSSGGATASPSGYSRGGSSRSAKPKRKKK